MVLNDRLNNYEGRLYGTVTAEKCGEEVRKHAGATEQLEIMC